MLKKGLLLCAGMGSRLRPITYTTAKHILPAANKPIIYYTIEMLRDAGIDQIGIVVGANRPEFEAGVGDGSRWGVQIDYIDQDVPLGYAHAVKIARDWAANEPFVMVLGDIMVENGVGDLVALHAERKPASILMLNHTDRPKQFGIAEILDGRIVGLEEKPEHPKSDLAVAGIYTFDSSIFDAIETVKQSPRGELELPDAIRNLITDGLEVLPAMVKGWWKDTGRPEDIIDLNRLLLDGLEASSISGDVDESSTITGNVVIESGAKVIGSVINGPAVVGADSVIKNAFVGPHTSIGNGVTIQASEIENSVVMDSTRITGVSRRIRSSLIGKDVIISGEMDTQNFLEFVVGDTSVLHVS